MSGGKYTSESIVFQPVITPLLLETLIKCGTEAVAEAGKAVELEKQLRKERQEYENILLTERKRTEAAVVEYKKNLQQQINSLEKRIRNMGVSITAVRTNDLHQRIEQLSAIISSSTSTDSNIQPLFLNLQKKESVLYLFEKAIDLLDPIIAEDIPESKVAIGIKDNIKSALLTGDVDGIRRLHSDASTLAVKSKIAIERKRSLRASYDNELARAKALCHITNTLAPYPLFSLEYADEAILKLKSISEKQMALIETLKTNPVPRMSKEQRAAAREEVANRICATFNDEGIPLERVTCVDNKRICYYIYEGALLKVEISDTGFVSFVVVGDPKSKTGFKNYDQKKVITAMEHFQKQYPVLQAHLEANKVKLTLHSEIEPCPEIVEYEHILSEEEKHANEQAVLAMLNSSAHVRCVDGG